MPLDASGLPGYEDLFGKGAHDPVHTNERGRNLCHGLPRRVSLVLRGHSPSNLLSCMGVSSERAVGSHVSLRTEATQGGEQGKGAVAAADTVLTLDLQPCEPKPFSFWGVDVTREAGWSLRQELPDHPRRLWGPDTHQLDSEETNSEDQFIH